MWKRVNIDKTEISPMDYSFEESGTKANSTVVTQWGSDLLQNGKVPLGLPEIDEKINGVDEGSVIALVTDPCGPGEMLALHTASCAPTTYITTARPESAIEKSFEDFGGTKGLPEYTRIKSTKKDSQDPVNQTTQLIHRNDNKKNYIVDTVNSLTDNVAKFVSQIKDATQENDGVIVLIFAQDPNSEFDQKTRKSMYLCDGIVEIYTQERESDSLQHRLRIPRMRGSRVLPDESLRLDISDSCSLDSRNFG
jgi:hypothetical protein